MASRSTCPLCCYAESDTFAHLDHRVIVRCSECSFLFAAEFDTDELERKYRKEYYASPDDPRIQKWIDQNSRVWHGLVDDVLRAKTDVANLLDIGAGTGGFLEAFHAASPATQLFAIESSPEARENLKRRLPDLGFPVISAAEIENVLESLDAVTLLQCLEHVLDPLVLCREIHHLLNPGGILLVSVPNRYSYKVLRQGTSETYCFSNTTHLQFFSRKTLSMMLRRAGFQQVERIKRFGGSELTGSAMLVQYAMRQLGLSTELRFVAEKYSQ